MPLGMEVGLSPGKFVLDGDTAPSPILRVVIRISKLDRKCGALPVVANFVAVEQQIILVKTRSVNRFRNCGDRLNFEALRD